MPKKLKEFVSLIDKDLEPIQKDVSQSCFVEHIEHLESRFKRRYNYYQDKVAKMELATIEDSIIIDAIAHCYQDNFAKHLRDNVTPMTAEAQTTELNRLIRSMRSRLDGLTAGYSLPRINDRAEAIALRNQIECCEDILNNLRHSDGY